MSQINLLLVVFRVSMLFSVAFTTLGCGGDTGSGPTNPSVWPTDGVIKLNCTILRRDSIQKWVERGWTHPDSADRIRVLLLQTMISDSSRVACTPGKDFLNVRPNARLELTTDTTCVGLTVTGSTIFSNAYVGFKMLEISNPDGTLKDFDYVSFRPYKKYAPFISYEIKIVSIPGKKGINKLLSETADPCPHYCDGIELD